MFERLFQSAHRTAERRARARSAALAARIADDVPEDVTVEPVAGGVLVSGRGLRRRAVLEPALRWPIMGARR